MDNISDQVLPANSGQMSGMCPEITDNEANNNTDNINNKFNGTIRNKSKSYISGEFSDHDVSNNDKLEPEFKLELYWYNITMAILLHVAAVYGIYLGIKSAQIKTILFAYLLAHLSTIGAQCGVHRLWCHRTYKAKPVLQYLLAFLYVLAFQDDIYKWSRDHRVHHKCADTDADPYSIKRGFFFAHIGWLLCRKHPSVIAQGHTIDMSDLDHDLLVQFERRYHVPLALVIWGAMPTLIPCAAHYWGSKPYDKHIEATECTIRHVMLGEGFHNYHHTYPWDYSMSEYGPIDAFNPATMFIDLFARLGWAYDMRRAPRDVVKQRMKRTGQANVTAKTNRVYEWVTATLYLMLMFYPFIIAGLWNNYLSHLV
ncbi:unnamed protein product [Medioppia subpectinata]|uniref:Fatty acid desaturase domain-containing protein n=1 Tax=Medioppia subpectinata TaxID=1979941 RepID=A0A7R9Q0J3_9ACAR|nr:unnamed protein product [Medioppia subpectinata]CAG2108146.1 unnamed protein product [Medioppia subpectinata]